MVVTKLIPNDLKLEPISEEAAMALVGSPEAIQDYINRLIDGYNNRVDNINESCELYNKVRHELEDYKTENRIMSRIISCNGLSDALHNDDEFLNYLCRDEDDILGLMGDDEEDHDGSSE